MRKTLAAASIATAIAAAVTLVACGVAGAGATRRACARAKAFALVRATAARVLPDGNGLEFCEKIRETSETPVLFLTANDTEEDMLEGFGVGCDDYISKPFSIEVLRKKVLAVLKRSGVGKFRMKYRDLELDKEKCLVLMKGQEIHLTSTEYKLLLYLMENRGRVVTKAMLLEQLWDIDGNFVDDNTVRVNIKRLRQKLNDEKQEYIVTVFGMGYSFGE